MHRPAPSARLAAVAGASALLLAACGGATPSADPAGESRIPVTVTESGCEPGALTRDRRVASCSRSPTPVRTSASSRSSTATASSMRSRTSCPGFVVNFATRIDGGDYELVCYALRSPRGTLAVTGGVAAEPSSHVIDAATLAGYQEQYESYVLEQAAELKTQLAPFVAAIEAGDLEAAKAAYAPSRPAWERIEPVAELFADLDVRMDAREEDFAGGVDDPEFLGWHRLEKGLWADGTTDGLAPIASGLAADAADLETRLKAMVIEPRVIARGAGELIEEVAQSKLTGEEDRYSQADLWSISANVAGSQQDRRDPAPDAPDPRRRLPGQRRWRLRRGRRGRRQVRRGRRLPALLGDQRGRPQGPPGAYGQAVRGARRAARPVGAGGLIEGR